MTTFTTTFANGTTTADMAAKAAYDKEYAACIAAGLPKDEAADCAQFASGLIYDAAILPNRGA